MCTYRIRFSGSGHVIKQYGTMGEATAHFDSLRSERRSLADGAVVERLLGGRWIVTPTELGVGSHVSVSDPSNSVGAFYLGKVGRVTEVKTAHWNSREHVQLPDKWLGDVQVQVEFDDAPPGQTCRTWWFDLVHVSQCPGAR